MSAAPKTPEAVALTPEMKQAAWEAFLAAVGHEIRNPDGTYPGSFMYATNCAILAVLPAALRVARAAAIEEAARVAEAKYRDTAWDGAMRNAAFVIAAVIRAMAAE